MEGAVSICGAVQGKISLREIGMKSGVRRPRLHGLPYQIHSLTRIVILERDDTEQVESIRVSRCNPKRLFIKHFCLAKAPGLLLLPTLLDQVLDQTDPSLRARPF